MVNHIPEKQIKITVCKHKPSLFNVELSKVECMASYNVGIKFKQDDKFQSHSFIQQILTVLLWWAKVLSILWILLLGMTLWILLLGMTF